MYITGGVPDFLHSYCCLDAFAHQYGRAHQQLLSDL